MRDITAYPDDALHSTSQVADFIGRTAAGVRYMVKKGVLAYHHKTRTSTYFTTSEIKRWLEDSKLFKDKRGAPSLKTPTKGLTDADESA